VKDRLKILDVEQFTERVSDELVRAKRYEHPLTLCALKLDPAADQNASPDQAGDLMAAHIRQVIRDVDIQCRYADDTVVLCLPETNPSCAQFIARRLADSLSNFTQDDRSYSISVKASMCPGDGPDATEMISSLVNYLSAGD
jgi:GGDEF domain-containing protein